MKETVNNAMNKHRIVTLCYLSCFRAIIHLGQLNCRYWYLGLRPTLPPQGKVFGHVKGHRDSAEFVGKVNKVFVFKEEIMA